MVSNDHFCDMFSAVLGSVPDVFIADDLSLKTVCTAKITKQSEEQDAVCKKLVQLKAGRFIFHQQYFEILESNQIW